MVTFLTNSRRISQFVIKKLIISQCDPRRGSRIASNVLNKNIYTADKPYCKKHHKTIYGTALHEPASVTCEVEAKPGPVNFRWTFNNTSEHLPVSPSAVLSQV